MLLFSLAVISNAFVDRFKASLLLRDGLLERLDLFVQADLVSAHSVCFIFFVRTVSAELFPPFLVKSAELRLVDLELIDDFF